MLKKTLIATGTLAVILFAASPQADAKTNHHVDTGVGVTIYSEGHVPGFTSDNDFTPNRYWSVRRILRDLRHRGYRGNRSAHDGGAFENVNSF